VMFRGGGDAMTRSEEEVRVGTASRETGRARLRKCVVTEQVQKTVPCSARGSGSSASRLLTPIASRRRPARAGGHPAREGDGSREAHCPQRARAPRQGHHQSTSERSASRSVGRASRPKAPRDAEQCARPPAAVPPRRWPELCDRSTSEKEIR
jgi:hypothetical protein